MSLASRQVGLVAEYTGRFALRSGTGLVFVLASLVTGLLLAQLILGPVEFTQEGIEGADEGEAVEVILETARPVVSWIVGRASGDESVGERWTTYLLDDRPALLSGILLLTMFAWPFLVALGAGNPFSGDVGSRRIRYLLLRVPRTRLFFGRLAGTLAFVLATLVVIVAIVTLYLGFNIGIYGWGELLGWAAWGVLAMTLMTLPYVALFGWISSAVDTPVGSFTLCLAVVGGVPLVALLGGNAWEPLSWARYLSPWGVQHQLMHYDVLHVVGAAAACLGYTAAFVFLGHRHFSRRDL